MGRAAVLWVIAALTAGCSLVPEDPAIVAAPQPSICTVVAAAIEQGNTEQLAMLNIPATMDVGLLAGDVETRLCASDDLTGDYVMAIGRTSGQVVILRNTTESLLVNEPKPISQALAAIGTDLGVRLVEDGSVTRLRGTKTGVPAQPIGAVLETAECPVTRPPDEAFVPPEPWPATPASDEWAWYGTDELWTVIEADGSLENKSVWWSVEFPGGTDESSPPLAVTFERLDTDVAPIVFDAPGTNAFTDADQWVMINGLEPREPGCWRATATYKGATLSYTYEVP